MQHPLDALKSFLTGCFSLKEESEIEKQLKNIIFIRVH